MRYTVNTSPTPLISVADRILVVDDIEDNSFLLQTVLEQEGYDVQIASSGREALDKVERQQPDLILLDVMMPEMNGFEVTQRIRQNDRLPFIPILLITGYDQFNPAEGFEFGADDFIRKPVDFDLLLDRIRAILPEDRNS
ncbi:response regulator [Leptolyngbya sp. NIES-2104]|uniref:response regulator n=1 Tax=Leptolyngbya sp. NIES-2104 TaxID=1552121 RepID=UPI0006EC4D04|nr:response regulator [Leptolyngbya sp. NIES-2104]GAP94124.1 two-component hybrid sensor and regulator [Leptolyngbya sp. NIES-2104]